MCILRSHPDPLLTGVITLDGDAVLLTPSSDGKACVPALKDLKQPVYQVYLLVQLAEFPCLRPLLWTDLQLSQAFSSVLEASRDIVLWSWSDGKTWSDFTLTNERGNFTAQGYNDDDSFVKSEDFSIMEEPIDKMLYP